MNQVATMMNALHAPLVEWRPIDERLFEHTGHVLLWTIEVDLEQSDSGRIPAIVWSENDALITETGEVAWKTEFLCDQIIRIDGKSGQFNYCTHYAIISPPDLET